MKTKILKFLKSSKGYIKIVLAIIFILVPYIIIYFLLQKKGKTLQVIPKFDIIDIENKDEVNDNIIGDVIKKGESIINKFKEVDEDLE